MIHKAIVNADGTGLLEGQPGPASQILPGGAPLTTTLRAGWAYGRELISAGWRFTNFDDASLGPLPEGHELVNLGIADGILTRVTQPSVLPVLDLPQIRSFIRRAGLDAIYDAAVTAAEASSDEGVRYAADSLTSGATFRFDKTMAAAAAVIALLELPEGVSPPPFGDPEFQDTLLTHWRDAYAQALPGATEPS